jgi:integrase
VIHAEQQYIGHDGTFGPTKGRRNRKVPCGPTLSAALREHRLATGRRDGLVFGANGRRPIDAGKLQERADAAWSAAGVERVTPHACRHLYATLMAAAGTPLERLSRYMGHSSIAVTWDNYGHLFPGDETTDAGLQEAFLGRPNVSSLSG